MRLEMALESAAKHAQPIIAMTHFPPMLSDYPDTEMSALLEKYKVTMCVYGHLHGAGIRSGFSGKRNGVLYRLVSCDAIGFSPVKIWDDNGPVVDMN